MISASRRRTGSFVPALAGLVPMTALAHPEGHGAENALAGLLHPLTGVDHLLAMVAVGLWAAQLGQQATRTLPIVFPVVMVAGALLALSGVYLPAIEPMIAASVIVLGVLVAARIRLPAIASAVIVAAFAIVHGYAHAADGPAGEMPSYAAGFVAATVLLHLVGVVIGARISRPGVQYGRTMTGAVGTAIALAGTAIFIT